METLILSDDEKGVEKAGEILRGGGLAAIPTETVYGLAADAMNEAAVKSIYTAKGRPSDNPLIVHIAEAEDIQPLVREIPDEALRLAQAFWPGPLTMILKKSDRVSKTVSGGLDTVALRFPKHSTAQAIIKAAGTPLAAPSANTSGKPSPTTFKHVRDDLSGRVDAIICGSDCSVGVESTVLSLAGDVPRLLRPGAVTVAQIEEVIGTVEVDDAVLNNLKNGEEVSSPGMKYKHYSPKADVVIVDASPEEYVKYVQEKGDGSALCFDEDMDRLSCPKVSYGTRYDGTVQAKRVFQALHKLDEMNVKRVYTHIPSKNGVGLAVYNRLIRSAGFQTVNPYGHYIIGLTGASGVGKSTVGIAFQQLGCGYVDCDAVTKSKGVYDEQCIAELKEVFGHDIAENGVLNRRMLAQRAFSSKEGKDILNKITHPRIMKHILRAVKSQLDAGYVLVVVDAPTLFEAGLDEVCARIVAVTASPEIQIPRIMERDGITKEEAVSRLKAQHPQEFYTQRADHIVNGAGGYDLLKRLSPIVNGLLKKCSNLSLDS